MPLVTVTVAKPKTAEFKRAVLDAAHAALVAAGVPAKDRFQRVIELGAEDFVFDAGYPDLAEPRSADFILVEILFSVGRNVKVKKQIVADIIAKLAGNPGANPEHVMVVFKETQLENWSFGGGRFISA